MDLSKSDIEKRDAGFIQYVLDRENAAMANHIFDEDGMGGHRRGE
jgi:hypothetical protein